MDAGKGTQRSQVVYTGWKGITPWRGEREISERGNTGNATAEVAAVSDNSQLNEVIVISDDDEIEVVTGLSSHYVRSQSE